MPTLNGSKWFPCRTRHRLALSNNFEPSLRSLVFLGLHVVTDNGPCFISEEFREFMTRNGIHHIRSSPYHPASNGLAERAVRVFKEGFKKMKEGTISDKIARFLFAYRNLPHSTTGVSPAELMFGRQLRSQLDLLKPSLESRVEHNQQRQKEGHDQHARERQFSVSDCLCS